MEDVVKRWTGRRVFLTGHTGFKGGWLALWLTHLGAEVRGYALDPNTSPNLFQEARIGSLVQDLRGDIRDALALDRAMMEFRPDVVFHLAAQPLVRLSYADPMLTYETNVMGTARLLDAVRRTPSVRAVVVVTTDKCYENREWVWGYRESDPLGGYDPYSSSKACAELVTAAFRSSYFCGASTPRQEVEIATARAGNVIGGGDWSEDRLIPDLVRGFQAARPVVIRNPNAVRPWQHVLEPLDGYIKLAECMLSDRSGEFAKAYNFGPSEDDTRTVGWVVEQAMRKWGDGASSSGHGHSDLHEAGSLKLDASRARAELDWRPRLDLATALDWVVSWYRRQAAGEDMQAFTMAQVLQYERLADPMR